MGLYPSREDEESSSSSPPTVIEDLHGGRNKANRGRRRKHSADQSSSSAAGKQTKLFKLETPKYLYQKLFLEGKDSDVTLTAKCGEKLRSWRLHRVYLEQCDYFRALFQRNRWKDSERNEYTLDINDPNICFEGLNNVLASLYNNEIEIDKEHVAGVVGAASLLNLRSVLDKCGDLLNTCLTDDTVLLCLDLADTYGFAEHLEHAFAHIRLYFWRCCQKKVFLKKLNRHWFVKVLSSPDSLCAKENELDLYTTMKNWIYLQHHREDEDDETPLNEREIREFFNSGQYDWGEYYPVLRHLRVAHIVLSLKSMKMIKKDGMLPAPLIDWVIRDSWNTLLVNEEAIVTLDESLDDDFFYRHCFRLGRSDISASQETTWRWTGYFFGLDLLVKYFAGTLKLTRNCNLLPAQQHLSVKTNTELRIHYRVIVLSAEGSNGSGVLLDTQRCSAVLRADRGIDVGQFRVPQSGNFSVHLLHLGSIPGPSSTHYWDNFHREASDGALRETQ